MSIIFLSSGLFLGWSLGANDTGNIWGTAVYSRMVRFKTAAILASIFVILGAVISGAGASQTLGKLGAVNAIAGSFTVAFGAALAVYLMVRNKLPVSTSQTIVGAIVGWNLFSGMPTDYNSLTKIVSTWIICPILAGIFAAILYYIFRFVLKRFAIHLLTLDFFTRLGLILIGIFGSYSLGANNIANVVGVFVPVNPFPNVKFLGMAISSTQLLFFMGGGCHCNRYFYILPQSDFNNRWWYFQTFSRNFAYCSACRISCIVFICIQRA
ncbi:inorganic phosphate transporter [Thermotomaculum hydrothermale]|uniref:inorganic phosphate transporter n=1 Tax=Thermotomaculum hydrothermale TaxID=981385 RepID=UPI001916B7A2|nr:inorganic phosphate transporter [Thermotomaculum hydrothermale]